MRASHATLAGLCAAMAVAGCLSPVDPDATPVDSVRLTFDGGAASDTIPVRGTTRVRAAAVARAGHVVARDDFAFRSSDTTIAVVDAGGVVRGVRVGTVRITAALPDGLQGVADVVVAPTGVAYTIPVGSTPGAMAFSADYTRLYVLVAPDSLAIVDALGYFRLGAVPLRLAGHRVAATGESVLVTHPDADSVSVLSAGTSAVEGRLWVGAGPTGVAATATRAFVAARYDRKVVIVEDGRATLGVPVDGEPHELAVSRDGARLFATVERAGAWRLAVIAPAYPDTLASLALEGPPTALATDAGGERVYVLVPSLGKVYAFAAGSDGRYAAAGSVDVGADAGGLSVRPSGSPLVVSGMETTIVDGFTMRVLERAGGAGTGSVGIRPDGVFAFVAAPRDGVLRVLGL